MRTLIAALILIISSVQGGSTQTFQKFSPDLSLSESRISAIKKELNEKEIIVPDGPSIPTPKPVSGTPVFSPGDDLSKAAKALDHPTVTPLEAARERIQEQFDPRIIGGRPAAIEDFPWQVVLLAGNTPPEVRSPFCGGSIIGSIWIVTAAHCLDGIEDASDVDIVSGTAYPKFAGQGDRISVAQLIPHAGYQSGTWENDIALLKLSKPIRLGRPITLPKEDLAIPDNALATVTGWGAVTAYSNMVDKLLKTNVPIISNETCNDEHSYSGAVKSGMLCAGYREGGFDACQGDSGGPLMSRINGTPTLVGVVSWGKGCALRLKYGVYTRVTSYVRWIQEQTGSSVARR